MYLITLILSSLFLFTTSEDVKSIAINLEKLFSEKSDLFLTITDDFYHIQMTLCDITPILDYTQRKILSNMQLPQIIYSNLTINYLFTITINFIENSGESFSLKKEKLIAKIHYDKLSLTGQRDRTYSYDKNIQPDEISINQGDLETFDYYMEIYNRHKEEITSFINGAWTKIMSKVLNTYPKSIAQSNFEYLIGYVEQYASSFCCKNIKNVKAVRITKIKNESIVPYNYIYGRFINVSMKIEYQLLFDTHKEENVVFESILVTAGLISMGQCPLCSRTGRTIAEDVFERVFSGMEWDYPID